MVLARWIFKYTLINIRFKKKTVVETMNKRLGDVNDPTANGVKEVIFWYWYDENIATIKESAKRVKFVYIIVLKFDFLIFIFFMDIFTYLNFS